MVRSALPSTATLCLCRAHPRDPAPRSYISHAVHSSIRQRSLDVNVTNLWERRRWQPTGAKMSTDQSEGKQPSASVDNVCDAGHPLDPPVHIDGDRRGPDLIIPVPRKSQLGLPSKVSRKSVVPAQNLVPAG